jgi:hypothetical protein
MKANVISAFAENADIEASRHRVVTFKKYPPKNIGLAAGVRQGRS